MSGGGGRGGLRAALGIALLLLVAGCGGEAAAPAPSEAPAGEQLLLQPAAIADLRPVAGEITSRDRAEAMPRIAGILQRLDVRAGDRVRKGQRIGLVVDQRTSLEADAGSAQVKAAEAAATQAGDDLARIRQLYDRKVYAKARLDQAVAAADAADASLAAARLRARAGASLVSQGEILAPADGRVLRADVPAGSAVAPGTSVATITAGPPVLRLSLPESLARAVRPGAAVLLDDGRKGEVAEVYPGVLHGEVRVDATVPGLDDGLIGARVAVRITIGERPALLAPRRFVETRYGIDRVRLLGADRQPAAVPVQLAPTNDPAMVEILSGVRAGDTLVVAGAPQ